jgi:hypothetical protein
MIFDEPTIVAIFVALSTAILAYMQYRLNAKVERSNASRIPAQNESDSAAALKSYAETNAITSKALADEKITVANLERRMAQVEKLLEEQRIQMILDVRLGEIPRASVVSIERMPA